MKGYILLDDVDDVDMSDAMFFNTSSRMDDG